jgi:hypothetical protein
MSMIERGEFSPEETEEIGKLSNEIATGGEEAIDFLVAQRFHLMGRIIGEFKSNLHQDGVMDWLKSMEHEVHVVNEVINRSRILLALHGLDTSSELRRLQVEVAFGKLGDTPEEPENPPGV